jgi:hypothetical protein
MEAHEVASLLLFLAGVLVGIGLALGGLAAIVYLGLTRFR